LAIGAESEGGGVLAQLARITNANNGNRRRKAPETGEKIDMAKV
jgi:hypothetical protein